jgi:hypothetical protein
MSNYSIRDFLKACCAAAPKLASLLKGVGLLTLTTALFVLAAGCETEKGESRPFETYQFECYKFQSHQRGQEGYGRGPAHVGTGSSKQ